MSNSEKYFDTQATIDALSVWGIWSGVSDGRPAGPITKTATDVMFVKPRAAAVMTQDMNELGEKMDRLMVALPDWDVKILKHKFMHRRSIEAAADHLRISRRTYERDVSIAIGRMSVLMATFTGV